MVGISAEEDVNDLGIEEVLRDTGVIWGFWWMVGLS